eukprot:TRINITY_DN13491_c0_g1_i1.p1 TRINITY_DN13491_c0_g1~~TRINITY_DN13491_c0_g1_i1.p1  ORF type:complete len:446 (-),score=131.39 TRINITY_DN13491_c0_g1_i1:3-1244(-)
MLRSLVGSEMCIRDSINAEYGERPTQEMGGQRKRAAESGPVAGKKKGKRAKDAAEKELEDLLFGTEEEDVVPRGDEEDAEDEAGGGSGAAWHDEDDDQVEVNIDKSNRTKKLRQSEEEDGAMTGADYVARLRSLRAGQTRGSKTWAQPNQEDDADDGLKKLARRRGGLMAEAAEKSTKALGANTLHVKRVKDANCTAPSKAVLQTVQFHPTLPILLTAGFDKSLKLFQADGQTNTKLQSVFLEDMPIRRAAFIPQTNSVLLTGRRPFYYVYDMGTGKTQRLQGFSIGGQKVRSLEDAFVSPNGSMMAFLGKDGYMILADPRTRRHVANLKMNGSARAACFSPDGKELISGGDEGCLYIWDVRMQRCSGKMEDDGALRTTCVTCSPDGKYWAAGCVWCGGARADRVGVVPTQVL